MTTQTCAVSDCDGVVKFGRYCTQHINLWRQRARVRAGLPRQTVRVAARKKAMPSSSRKPRLKTEKVQTKRRRGPVNFVGRRTMLGPYVIVYMPDHPLAWKNGWVAEHRMVAHDAGLTVRPTDDVHHINGDKADNRIENLEVMTHGEHTASHAPERRSPPGRRAPVQKRSWGLATCPAYYCDRPLQAPEFCCLKCWKRLPSAFRWRVADDETATLEELLDEADRLWRDWIVRRRETEARMRDQREARGLPRYPESPERRQRVSAQRRARRAARTSPAVDRECA